MHKDVRRKKARALRKQGMALKEIAERLGIGMSTAFQDCVGVLPKGANKLDLRREKLMPQFSKLYQQGMAIPKIAEILDVPAPTLFDWRKKAGLEKNKRSAYVTDELRERISRKLTVDPDGVMRKEAIEMYVEQEIATTEIAEKLGVTTVTVAQWLEQEGIARRQSPTLRTREKLREANLGEKRYNWKGGISTENRRHRLSMYMRDARKACFERDDYTCRSCGQRGGKLNAHHVWPFQRWQEWKYEVWNLVTLCKLCHDNWHKSAGGHVKIAIGPFFAGPVA